MRLDYIHPIVESAVEILTEVTGAPVERGEMSLHRSSTASKDIVTIVGMTGEVEGRIVLEMDKDTAVALAGVMNEERFTELTPLALDTLMELTNVLVAKAVSTLNDQGFAFRLTPPLIFTGGSLSFFSNLNLETLVIPLRGRMGDVNLSIALRMSAL